MKKYKILVFLDIKHHYAVNLENRKLTPIIEIITTASKYLLLSIVIIQVSNLMVNWFFKDLLLGIFIIYFELSFTLNKIFIEYLKYFIKLLDLKPNRK